MNGSSVGFRYKILVIIAVSHVKYIRDPLFTLYQVTLLVAELGRQIPPQTVLYVLIVILQQLSGLVRSTLNLLVLQLTRKKQQVVTVKE